MDGLWGIFVITLLVTGTLLAAGCMAPPKPIDSRENPGVPATTFSITPSLATTTSVPVQCQQENQSLYINISPIADHYPGDIITVEGTTNLEPGEPISLAIYEDYGGLCPKVPYGCEDSVRACCGGFLRTVVVIPGDCGINTWSWKGINTSQHGFRPDSFIVEAWEEQTEGIFVDSSRRFNIILPSKPDLIHIITISQPEKAPESNSIKFSGISNTDNGPRERIVLWISSDIDNTPLVNATLPVVFDGTGNVWNYSLASGELAPGNYTVNVSSLYNPKIGNTIMFRV